MLSYPYRICGAFLLWVLVIFFAYFYDISAKFTEISALREKEKKIRALLAVKKSLPSLRTPLALPTLASHEIKNELFGLANVIKLAHLKGLSIHLLNSLNKSTLHLVAEGSVAQVFSFIATLEKEWRVKIVHFSSHLSAMRYLQMEADIELPLTQVSWSRLRQIPNLAINNHPFCLLKHTMMQFKSSNQVQSFPVSLIKMVGYVQQGKEKEALLLLPNQELITVAKGQLLGKEKARVEMIAANRIQLDLATHLNANKSPYFIELEHLK